MESLKVRAQELEKQLIGLAKRREENNNRQRALEGAKKEQDGAEQKALARKKDLKKYSNLDGEITRIEKLRTEHQAARDAFFANQKDAQDLTNRRKTLKEWMGLIEKYKQTLAAKQKELAELEKDYDLKHHTEVSPGKRAAGRRSCHSQAEDYRSRQKSTPPGRRDQKAETDQGRYQG